MLSDLECEGTICSGDTIPKAEDSDKLSRMANSAQTCSRAKLKLVPGLFVVGGGCLFVCLFWSHSAVSWAIMYSTALFSSHELMLSFQSSNTRVKILSIQFKKVFKWRGSLFHKAFNHGSVPLQAVCHFRMTYYSEITF
jgi:hypothetical protein